ncbi:hypothetical protein ON010_g9693 [Phytophthora cinnamomi]|nr:hypothetical protein ON010_g9693 [Phytophthora cinnamomi]
MVAESSDATAYKTRETLRKTLGVVINDFISKGISNNGTTLNAEYYAYQAIQKGLPIIFRTSRQSVVPLNSWEKLTTVTKLPLWVYTIQKAFKGSTSSWTRVRDGAVIINFTSTDTEDVTVNIKSGGDKIDEVRVPAGRTAAWTSNTTSLSDKTLYLDRWRPGFLGLPGTGGGSLVLWVPKAAEGDHLELNVRLNVS